jgi:hypothetical protein
VPAGVPVVAVAVVVAPELVPPPHAVIITRDSMTRGSNVGHFATRRFVLRGNRITIAGKHMHVSNSANSPSRGQERCLLKPLTTVGAVDECAVVLRLTEIAVVLTPDTKAGFGVMLQLVAGGSPVHEKATVPVKPDVGVMLRLYVAVPPAVIVVLFEEPDGTEIVNSVLLFTVTTTATDMPTFPAESRADTLNEWLPFTVFVLSKESE